MKYACKTLSCLMMITISGIILLPRVWPSLALPVKNSSLPKDDPCVFSNPELVTIRGYSGPAQDAYITPDSKYLFFDSHNDGGLPCYLYWAKFVDYKNFDFMGEIQGVNHPGEGQVRGNCDTARNFYFASTAFPKQGQPSVGRGVFNNGSVSSITPVQGIYPRNLPSQYMVLDPEITPDGTTLFFSEFNFRTNNLPLSHIAVAARNQDGSFTRLPNSGELLKSVNALGPTVYGSMPSKDGLELYVTAAYPQPVGCRIYVATRNSVKEPFAEPRPLRATEVALTKEEHPSSFGSAESGSISADGTHFYYHRIVSDTMSKIYVVTRHRSGGANSIQSVQNIVSPQKLQQKIRVIQARIPA